MWVLELVPSFEDIGEDKRIQMAHVWFCIDVVDGCCYIVWLHLRALIELASCRRRFPHRRRRFGILSATYL
jgi:hypothetical protein